MSALGYDIHQGRRRPAAGRRPGDGRSRRAGAGSVTEMARLLLREAREAEDRGREDAAAVPVVLPAGDAQSLSDAA